MNLRRRCDAASRRTVGLAHAWTRNMPLDTSFLVDLLEGRPDAISVAAEIDRYDEIPYVPSPVLFELWEGAERSVRPATERARLEDRFRSYGVVPLDGLGTKAAGAL